MLANSCREIHGFLPLVIPRQQLLRRRYCISRHTIILGLSINYVHATGEQLLDTRMHNTFIDMFLILRPYYKAVHRPGNWVEDAWLVYGAMEHETAVPWALWFSE